MIEEVERYADGQVDRRQLDEARLEAVRMTRYAGLHEAMTFYYALDPATHELVLWYAGGEPEVIDPDTVEDDKEDAIVLREIFGNPFHPIAPDPSWMPQNAVVLARTMYESRDFTLMPLLADLLEEAGCPADVAQHCRGPGPHVRGCWVVDLVLGRE